MVSSMGASEERVAVVRRTRFKSQRGLSSRRDGLRKGVSTALVALVAALLLLAVGGSIYIFSRHTSSSTSTPPPTSTLPTSTPPSNLVTVDTCGTEVTFNGTQYCSLDVSNFTTVSLQSYANMNHPVNFMGVLFQTVCPSYYEGCPIQGATTTVMPVGIVELNLTFGDGTNETVSALLGISCPNSPILTQQHLAPQAGFYLDCVTGSPVGPIKLILLVEVGVLYNVTLQQDGVCSPEVWIATWSVTVGNQTIVLPEGTPLPLDDNSWASTENQSLSAITFALPDGSYTYQVHPASGFTPSSGVVNVAGGDVVIHISPIFSCTTTIAATP
jgi:hypothetical protein